MPNANTIYRLMGGGSPAQGSLAIPSFVPSGTSAAIVPCQTSSTTAAWLPLGDSTAQPTGAQTYGSGFDGFCFKVRVAWKVTTKAANNVTIAIMYASSATTTYTAGNVVATTGATSNGTISGNGFLEYVGQWDSTSLALSGYYSGFKGATTPAIVAPTIQTNNLAPATQASLGFEIAATFSDTTAGTTLTITEFTAEML
jgi:hypothetical protein